MKILILTDEYPPVVGGAGIVAKQLFNDFKESGHDVSIFTPNRSSYGKLLFKLFWIFYYFTPGLINKLQNQDLIIINDIRSAYFISLVSMFRKIDFNKINYILHGTEYEIIYTPSKKNKIILLPFFYNKFLTKINEIIAVSHYTKNTFIKNSSISKKIHKKIKVVYPGISNEIKSHDIKIKANSTFKLVSVSRLEPRKGYLEMFEIFKELLKYKKDILWYIYGDGSLYPKLKDMIIKEKLQDKIFIMGAKDRLDIYQKEFPYYGFDLFWLLPNKPEAFGLVYIEASMVGVPALGIKKYGIKESVNNLFYRDIPSLIHLIESISLNKEYYAKEAIRFAQNFKSKSLSDRLIDNGKIKYETNFS